MIAAVLGSLVLLAPSTPRERIRFDANWRFLVEAAPAQSPRGPFVWEWKRAPGASLDLADLPGDLAGGDWKRTQLGENTLSGGGTFAWYRTELGSDPQGAEKVLRFESVDDNAVVFLNGKRLARHIGFGTAFDVPVRDAWKAGGPNTLVVLIENTAAGGGINGGVQFELPEVERTPENVQRAYDDSTWPVVHLPHDYVVEGRFDPKGDVGHGSLPKPLGTYRKTFTPPETLRGKSVWIDFDGVYRNSTVYLNGQKLGTQSSGYMGFRYDLSKRLEFGKPNTLAVRVDPRQNEGWWYEGGGIYRHVWLNAADPVHVAPDGIFARAKVGEGTADVSVDVTLANDAGAAAVDVHSSIFAPDGALVGGLDAKNVSLPPSGRINVAGTLAVKDPALWDLGKPNLYRVVTTVRQGAKKLDEQTVRFGIRSLRWDKDKGFFLNGKAVKLLGTCNHQDHAGVGIALPDGLQEWRVRQLLKMGSNAYRTSHNPDRTGASRRLRPAGDARS